MKISDFKHSCSPEHAVKFQSWIASRGGVANWKSQEIGGSQQSWSTPATIRLGDCDTAPSFVLTKPICPQCKIPIRQEGAQPGQVLLHCTACSQDFKANDVLVDYPEPNWRCGKVPPTIITDGKDICVIVDKEIDRFEGTKLNCRRVQDAISHNGPDTYAQFDSRTDEIVVFTPEKLVPLNEWKAE